MESYDRVDNHTAVSNAADLYGYFSVDGNPCSHFYIDRDGGVIQYVDTSFRAAANFDGNATGISIETWDGYGSSFYPKGAPTPGYTEAQLRALVALTKWIIETHPTIPLKLAVDSLPGNSSKGISWHRLGVPYRTTAAATERRIPTAYADGYLKAGGIWYSSASGKVCPGDLKTAQLKDVLIQVRGDDMIAVPLPPTGISPTYTVAYIKGIQTLLNGLGDNLVVDGDLGPLTKGAVIKFQEKNGLYVDGDPGTKTYAKLVELTKSKEETVAAVAKYVDPYPGRVTSHFSALRKNPATGKWQSHLGTDIAPVPAGTRNKPVRSFQAGTVTAAGVNILAGRTGNGVIVQHTPTFRTYYGHLDRVNVKKNQVVDAGTTLGVGGATGNVTGVHLHFETHYLQNGKWVAVNPYTDVRTKYGIVLGAGSSSGQVTTSPGGSDSDRNIQNVLKNLGFYNGIVDGINGSVQKTAVRSFQGYVGLVPDGSWGPLTQARFEALGRPSSRAALDVALTPAQSGTQAHRNIQTAMKNLGFYAGIVDGINGNLQKSAVSQFQGLVGLVVDGEWGPLTQARWEALGQPQSRAALDAAIRPAPVVLRKGSVRGEVGRVQQGLRNKGYSKQIVDNDFGNQTEFNVKDWQRRKGLVVDGIVTVGGPTWSSLGL